MTRHLHSISQILTIPMLLCAGAGMGAASPAATTTSIDVGVATLSNSQQVYTLTATVRSGNAAISPGLVTFYLNFTTPIGSAQLKSNGQAAIKVRIPLGEEAVTASFNGTQTYAASTSSQANVYVTGPRSSSSTTIGTSGSAGNYSVSAAVSAAGPQPPTGTVTFYDQTNGNYNLGGAALGAPVSTLGFAAAANYPAGGSPQSVAVGDFNNDGIPDVVVTNSTDHNVGVFLGNADGTFQSQVTYATGPNPVFIVIADFNSDGALDLAVVDKDFNTHGFSVLLGNGNGTFNGHTEYSIGILGYTPSAAAVGDFNNDGIPDIAVTTYSGNAVSVLLGNGTGGFHPPHAFPGDDAPVGIVAADFNGDGFVDLAMADYFGVGVALSKGDGTFQTVVIYPAGTSPIAVAAGDFNNDGHIDLAVADNYNGTVNVLLGNSNGTFQAQTAYDTGSHPTSVAIADFNADGFQDLVVANNGGNNIGILLGNGNGTFQTQTTYSTPAGTHGVAVGDFNGDVLADIVTANTSGSASVLLNTVTETATAAASISIPGGGTHNIYASWPGDASHQGSTSSTTAVQGKAISTTTTLSGPSSAVQQGLPVRLVATIQPSSLGNYSPTGSVAFTCTSCGANSALGSVQVSSASATLTTYSLPLGPNTIVAAYNGGSNFSGSGSNQISVTIVADGAPTQTLLTASASQALTGQSVQFTATVTAGGNPLTSGTVTFQENGVTLFGPITLNGTNTAQYTTSSLSEGIHNIAAVYNDPSNTYYPSSSSVSIEIDSPTVSPQSGEFCNNGGDSIGSSSGSLTASVYPSRVNVTNVAGTVQSVAVFLNNIYQADPQQTAMLLQSPAGANLVFWEAAGGPTAPPSSLTVFFQDGNPYLTGAVTSGVFSPTALDNSFVFPSPAAVRRNYAPPAGSQTFTTAFQNINPNGYWSLFWANAFGSYPAQFSNWCLIVNTNPPVLAIGKSHTGSFTQGDTADTYTITVTNNGPGSTAGTLTLTDTLPAGLTATTMSQTSHSGGGTGSDWTCTFSTSTCTRASVMPQGETDTILLTVSVASNAPTGTNAVTNTATVTGASAAASDPTTINASNASVSFSTVPAGLSYSVDGTTYTSSRMLSLAAGPHTIAVTSPQTTNGVQNTFASWSDNGAQSHQITVSSGSSSYVATFNTSYLLTTSASPSNEGTVSPASGTYYASGTVVNLTATPNTGYKFVNWTGNVTNNTVTMNAPQTVTANFAVNDTNVTIQTSPSGLLVNVDNGASQAAPVMVSWQEGSSHTIATSSPQSATGTKYTFTSWSDSGALSHGITVPQGGGTYTASFSTSYLLTTAASPSNEGTVSPASGSYYASGTVVNLTATPNTGYKFVNWTGNVTNSTVTMNAPRDSHCQLRRQQYECTIQTSPSGLLVSVDNGASQAAPVSVSWQEGSSHTIATSSPQGSAGTRYTFSGWSDSGTLSHSITVPQGGATLHRHVQYVVSIDHIRQSLE